MAIDDSELARGTATTTAGEPESTDAPGRFSLDDFRLRLDSPLFHRDPGVAMSEPAAQLRELTWEKVVRPSPSTSPQTVAAGPETTPGVEDFRAQLIPAAALPPSPLSAPSLSAPPLSAPPLSAPTTIDEAELELMRAPREPVAPREPDPVLTGLAELILRRVSGEVPAVPTEPMTAAPAYNPTFTPPSTPAVEAELNRLAFLPDIEEPAGPVEVPIIHTSDQPVITAAPFVPSLSQHDMYAPRSAMAPVAPRRNYAELAANLAPPSRARGRQRRPVRRIFAFVVLLGLLGGGLFAAKYYFLDQRWSGEIKPMAAEVETARGLSFDHAVKVTSLPAAEYSTKLLATAFGLDPAHTETVAGEWRALGLLSGALDVSKVGLAGIADAPAFYDAGSEKIYVVAGLPADLRRFALQRALALALLDQHYGWGSRIAHASPSVAHGTRALYDADALSVATTLLDESERVNVLTQQQALYSAYQIPSSTVPFATTVATRLGLALRPYFDGAPLAARDALERNALISDGQALDLRRLVSGTAETPSGNAQGMLFWYHVLATRIDTNTAWLTALSWRRDDVSVVQGTSGVCVTAQVRVDPASFDGAVAAFKAWAGAAPAASTTSVTAVPGTTTGQLTVTACDPGATVPTNDGRVRLSLGGAPLRAEQFRQLQLAFPQLSTKQLACAVYGKDKVSPADERSLIDPVEGWGALASHPSTDPNTAGCAAS